MAGATTAPRHRARAREDRARGRLLRVAQALPERRLLPGSSTRRWASRRRCSRSCSRSRGRPAGSRSGSKGLRIPSRRSRRPLQIFTGGRVSATTWRSRSAAARISFPGPGLQPTETRPPATGRSSEASRPGRARALRARGPRPQDRRDEPVERLRLRHEGARTRLESRCAREPVGVAAERDHARGAVERRGAASPPGRRGSASTCPSPSTSAPAVFASFERLAPGRRGSDDLEVAVLGEDGGERVREDLMTSTTSTRIGGCPPPCEGGLCQSAARRRAVAALELGLLGRFSLSASVEPVPPETAWSWSN